MQAAGIIVEYNPFHQGHLYHLNETKRLTGRDYIIAVMSGNFVQRGEPAICDKWQRVKMALAHGVDMVIELPVYYAVSGSAYFARGAVQLLQATGVTDSVCFGSEYGELDCLQRAAVILSEEPPVFKDILRKALDNGASYPAARALALTKICGALPDVLLTKPNNNLGIEYLKAIKDKSFPLTPFTFPRKLGLPSASDIRKTVRGGELYPFLEEAIKNNEITCLNAYSELFIYLLFKNDFTRTPDMTTDLLNRFRFFAERHRALPDLLAAVKTKRYTYTRLQRIVMHSILNIAAEDMIALEAAGGPSYIRVLGFRKESERLLGAITRRATLPVITSPAKARGKLSRAGLMMLEKEAEAARIYALAHPSGRIINEFSAPLIIM